MSEQALCDLKHTQIDQHLEGLDKITEEHNVRIRALEKSQVKTDTVVTNLCKKMDTFMSIMLGCTGTLLAVLVGFFIWYIQNIK